MLHAVRPVLGLAVALGVLLAPAVQAGPETRPETRPASGALGFGHFLDNDLIGDGKDRWQTGSYTLSWLRGPGWSGDLPDRPFEILEYRLGGAIIAPSKLQSPPPGDRRYAARSQVAVHTQFALRQGIEADLGLGVVWVGSANGLSQFHRFLHKLLNMPAPDVARTQVPNHLYPTLSAELARPFALGKAEARPFVEARAGDETFVRVGVDLAFGARETGALWLRDEVTGHRYVGIAGQSTGGTAFVLGADVAHVFDSHYLSAGWGAVAEPTRTRLRAGIDTRLGDLGVFYGVTWLSREFAGQPEGQLVGSVRLRMVF